jgi:O-antigen/teichoic acid export membrane protein
MDSNKQIKKGALISYIGIAFNVIAGLIYTPWMIHQIGKSDYSLYMLSMSFLAYFIMDFGLGQAIAKFVAKYRIDNNEQKIAQLLGLTAKLYLIIDMVIAVVLITLYFYLETIFKGLTSVEIERFKVIYVISGLFSLVSFPFTSLNGILIAYERFVLLKTTELISKMSVIILMVIALLLDYTLYALVAINAFVGLLIIVIKIYYLVKSTNTTINYGYKNKGLLKELFSISIWVSIIGIAQRLLIIMAPTILAIYSGTAEIAIFSIAMVIEGYTWTLANALNGLFLTKVSKLSNFDDRTAVTNLMIKVGRIQLYIVGILIIGFIVFGKEFIELWVGTDFENSYYVALLLVVLGLITLTQEIASTILFVEDKLKYKAILLLVSAIFSLLISISLAPYYGAIGVSFGIFTAILSCHVVGMNIIYWKILKIDVFYFFKNCHLKIIPILLVTLLTGFMIQQYMPVTNLLLFFPKVLLLSFLYFVMIWFFGLNKFEKELVISVKKRISLV